VGAEALGGAGLGVAEVVVAEVVVAEVVVGDTTGLEEHAASVTVAAMPSTPRRAARLGR